MKLGLSCTGSNMEECNGEFEISERDFNNEYDPGNKKNKVDIVLKDRGENSSWHFVETQLDQPCREVHILVFK